jgi:hypothetical protein
MKESRVIEFLHAVRIHHYGHKQQKGCSYSLSVVLAVLMQMFIVCYPFLE